MNVVKFNAKPFLQVYLQSIAEVIVYLRLIGS